MAFTQTQAFDDACLSGLMWLINGSVNPAYAILYEGSVELVTLVFAQPATDVVDHVLVFYQESLSGDLIHTQGDANHFKLYTGENVLVGEGDVSDAEGDGALKISGTTGTRLYAGARAILDTLAIG